jgi:peptidyl-prolyl cis-trans isomerase C
MFDRLSPRMAVFGAFLMGLSAFWTGPVAAQDDEDPIAARVEGREIRRSQVLESARDLPPAYLEQIETIFPFLRDRLVDFELVAIEGRKEGLAEDAEVAEMVRAFEDEAIRHIYLRRFLESEITDEMLQARYDAVVAAQPAVEEVRARHILVENEEAAREIISALDGGADFATLAKERSIDRASAEQYGGDLGYFIHDEMVTPFADAAFAMEAGHYTADPVQTEYGWHVIYVDDHRVKAPAPFDEMRGELESQLAETLVRDRLEELRADADIELYDYNGDEGEAATLPDESAPAESAPAEAVPEDSAPEESAPEESVPEDEPAVQ